MATSAKKKSKKVAVHSKRAAKKAPAKKAPAKKAPAKKAPAKKAPAKKAPAKKAPAKKAPAKKAPAKKAPAKKAAVAKKLVLPKRPPPGEAEIASGPRSSQRRRGEAKAFLPDPNEIGHRRVRDDLAEELGQEFVAAATSGEAVDDERDAELPEEEGGPFITTSAERQYGHGTDESNPEDAEREPFPTTRNGR